MIISRNERKTKEKKYSEPCMQIRALYSLQGLGTLVNPNIQTVAKNNCELEIQKSFTYPFSAVKIKFKKKNLIENIVKRIHDKT